jgi:Membrane domain of glycerophosphoryl diester phosphodiesterase
VNAGRRMYVHHLGLFLGIGLLFFPVGALISVLQYLLFRASGLDALVDSAGETNALVDGLAIGLGVVLTVFGLAIVQSATSIAMVELDAGREITALGAYRKALPKLGSLLGATLIAVVVIAIVDLTAVGLLLGIWLAVRWAFLAQVITLGGTSTRSALSASSKLVRGNWWRVASLLLFVTVIALLLGPLFGTLLLFVTSASFDFINLIASVVYAVVLPYVAIVTTYLYFDLLLAQRRDEELAETGDVLPAEALPPALAPNQRSTRRGRVSDTGRIRRAPLVVRALAVAGADRVALGVHRALERDVGGVPAVVRVQPGPLPHHVGGDAGPGGRDPVLLADARRTLPLRDRPRVRVAADPRVPPVEAVTEHPGRPVRDERVLAQPPLAVRRVEGVEEEQPAVVVRRRAQPRRAEAADPLAVVGVLAEDLLEAAAVDPVRVDVELGE